MRGRAAFGGTAGGAAAPLTTQGRLAPVRLVPELALGGLRAMERQLGRLVICELGREAILLFRPPHQTTLDTARDSSELLGSHGVGVWGFSSQSGPLPRTEMPHNSTGPASRTTP